MSFNPLHISKLDASKRQLDAVISMFFHNGDIVAIHTLASATHDVLKDMCDSRGIDKYFVKNEKVVKRFTSSEETIKKYNKAVRKAQNFFKHADRDGADILDFDPGLSNFFIWDATHMYSYLTNENVPMHMLFRLWFLMSNPDLADVYPSDEIIKLQAVEQMKKWGYVPENRLKFLDLLPLIKNV